MSKFLSFLFIQGDESGPWNNKERVSVLCPVPGYDRHFKLCETFGINMIPISLNGRGSRLRGSKDTWLNRMILFKVFGVYRNILTLQAKYIALEVIEGLLDIFSRSKNKGTIFWDNAYAVHDLSDQTPTA